MARGLHRFCDMDLRYGEMYGRQNLGFKSFRASGNVALPRGNFRFTVIGAGGGGAFYFSTGTTQNATGAFSGNFGAACGGMGGIIVFDARIPKHGTIAACTVGGGGTGKTASSTTAAGTGGQSKIVISDLGITVTANGGAGGKAGASKANCTAGAGGAVSATGVTAVASVSRGVAEVQTGDNFDRYVSGRHYVSKLDYSYESATNAIVASFAYDASVYAVLSPFMPKSRPTAYGAFGIGGDGCVEVMWNSDTDKYRVFGYPPGGSWVDIFGRTNDGVDGGIIIERL